MDRKSLLFPGQGSQFVGMGKDLHDTYPEIVNLYSTANDIMDTDLAAVCFEGPEEKLRQTSLTQPAIFVHSIAVFTLLKQRGLEFHAVAGHSLGEYSALVAAGAMSFETGLKLVKERGRLMQRAGEEMPGTMAALIGLSPEQVSDICKTVKHKGIVQAANYNSPGQIAISGDIDAVHAAMEEAKRLGSKRVVELVVSGAFHSPLMASAQEGLAEALKAAEITDPAVPVYSNVAAKPTTSNSEIRDLLYKQLTAPVRWTEIIQNMVSYRIHNMFEVGPGKVLCGLNRRIDRTAKCTSLGSVADLEKLEL